MGRLARVATVVAFHAHPDDEVLLTGGTIAGLAAAGHRVVVVVACDTVVVKVLVGVPLVVVEVPEFGEPLHAAVTRPAVTATAAKTDVRCLTFPPVHDVDFRARYNPSALTRRSDAQHAARCVGRLPIGHVDKLQPAAGSDVVPVDVCAVHVDDQHARIRDLVLVEYAVVARFAVAEYNREGHASSMAAPQPAV